MFRPSSIEIKQMADRGWHRVNDWKAGANDIAPTIVGGSKKHDGGDLGTTRAKQAWVALGVKETAIPERDKPGDVILNRGSIFIFPGQSFPSLFSSPAIVCAKSRLALARRSVAASLFRI